MASLSSTILSRSPAARRRITPASAKLHRPECFATSAWMGSSSKNLSLSYQLNHKKISVATVDAPQVHDHDGTTVHQGHDAVKNIEDPIEYIRTLLRTTGDGRISVSPYDTAWVAMIKDVEGRDGPQFPSSLEWIVQNQLEDGSWGDQKLFCVYDRLVNTIACVVALRSWNVHAHKVKRGVTYIKENVDKLMEGNEEHMTCGFEVVFPALLQKAKSLGIEDLPYDSPAVQEVYHVREQKLKRIPLEIMHKIPTSLLFSLEGLENLDWDKLLKLQSADGSFLTSPSSTAFAFMQTKDEKCYQFIKNTIDTFNGGAPHTYPVDVFGRLWAIDRLQRLGISRFFEPEIADCLSHIHKFWTDKGVFSGRESEFCDIDDTSMGMRLMRMHGYDVDPNVLRNFKQKDGKFSCYGGQMIESPSPIYNLYRASQLRFPGEEILEDAKRFAYDFLKEKLANNQILDKWVISKHLPDEIKLGLEMPWLATLPRVEAKYYIQYYAGSGDVWIGKTLYRMPEISNDTYHDLAKTDFKRCQAKHQFEWLYMQEWYESCGIEEFGISRKDLLLSYFLATASIFELERTNERIAWAKSQIIAKMITSFFNKETTSEEDKRALLNELGNINGLNDTNGAGREGGAGSIALATLTQFLEGFDRYTRHQLKNAWSVWLTQLQHGEADDAELLTNTLNICAGHIAFREEILAHNEYKALSNLTSKICRQLSFIQSEKEMGVEGEIAAKSSIKNKELEEDMQMLVKLVLEKYGGIDRNIKKAFLAVAKTYYYRAYHAADTIDTHMFKVLFEPVA
uniref:Copalyl diphosphate synthase CPS1, chloroplastic n=3 Tax=Salvia miltiorrhiza TaxID=226208 RepID=CPS1_SALMI|nr:RecName: Full=Copalyl diphosphate synthase CPS1, chloroplastic; Short=Copalyl diphosphate synthase 1; Short=SmCPS; Short=SmCPS1; Flags: Precursor [Salvia miltiorrhiza]ABV57835.1 copalyl diphosphate synthase [Salvia miltiorrhiza]